MSHLVRTSSSAATVTVTEQVQASSSSSSDGNPYDSTGGSAVSKLVPGILIAFFCFAAVCLAYVLVRTRRRRRRRQQSDDTLVESEETGQRGDRRKKRGVVGVKPTLWDVEVETKQGLWDLEALRPVAVELQADPRARPTSSKSKDSHGWFSHKQPHHTTPTTHHAQLTYLVSMPTPTPHRREQHIALGTAMMPYHDDDEDEESDEEGEDELPKLLDRPNVYA